MSKVVNIWKPVSFDVNWCKVSTAKFDNIFPSWQRKREEFIKNQNEYEKFLNQLKRKQAIDTGIIEKMYNLKDGITETFIKEGFVESYLQHGDTDIEPNLLMSYLKDNFEAIDFIFDFIKSDRPLTVGFIKELHALITDHQNSTEAIDQFGRRGNVPLLKGQYKIAPNNPKKISDDKVFEYCSPEQVASEMDMLIKIYSQELRHKHTIIKAAFLHHSFVQIHPFQDGNGRIARLLASLVFIKEGLFPLALDRNEKVRYINSLEKADNADYQELINLFAENQILSIEKALNYKIIEASKGYSSMVAVFANKIDTYNTAQIEVRNREVKENMMELFSFCTSNLENYKNDLKAKINSGTNIFITSNSPKGRKYYYYTKQIVDFANVHSYYFNAALDKCWIILNINITERKKYRLVFSIHHYGYDNSTFAIGVFLSFDISDERAKKEKTARFGNSKYYIDIPLEIKPLIVSSEIKVSVLSSEIERYIEDCVTVFLAYISNEL